MADRAPAPDQSAAPSLIDAVIDRTDAFAARWSTAISALSIAWFVATCADYAGFIDMPIELPLSGWMAILPAAVWNALWWGFAYPRIAARRAERTMMENPNG